MLPGKNPYKEHKQNKINIKMKIHIKINTKYKIQNTSSAKPHKNGLPAALRSYRGIRPTHAPCPQETGKEPPAVQGYRLNAPAKLLKSKILTQS